MNSAKHDFKPLVFKFRGGSWMWFCGVYVGHADTLSQAYESAAHHFGVHHGQNLSAPPCGRRLEADRER